MEGEDSLKHRSLPIDDEILRGLYQVAVLALLIEPQHGYRLGHSLKEHGLRIESGTLYPLLRRLESRGLLQSSWDTEGSHPRKMYETTMSGRALLERLKPLWETFVLSTQQALENPDGETK
jgi:DNA-binding PadR family transcriptional regulator